MTSSPPLEDLRSVNWPACSQPEWNAPDAIPTAIVALAQARSSAEADAAYNRFLYAVGNNHAGTYYPVVLETLRFLRAILESCSQSAQQSTLNVLIDLVASFAPDPAVPASQRDSLQAEFHDRVRVLWTSCRHSFISVAGTREAALAVELDKLLTDS